VGSCEIFQRSTPGHSQGTSRDVTVKTEGKVKEKIVRKKTNNISQTKRALQRYATVEEVSHEDQI